MKRIMMILALVMTFCTSVKAQNDTVPASTVSLPSDTLLRLQRPGAAGPKTTPVDVDDEKPRVVMHYYDKHGEPLEEPVMFLAVLDTVQKAKSGPVYPRYNGVNVGVDFGDLIFMAFGQKHASFGLWANVSLFNWLFPTAEIGLGYAKDTPDKGNFTYRTKPSFYAKIGLNYNFLYKSNPDYQLYLGLRAGYSGFKYDITDVTVNSDYWGEHQQFSLTGLKSNSFYGELLAGIQVKIVGGFSLGWAARWHFRFSDKSDRGNKPWFVPGYGGSNPFAMSVNAIWTIPAPKKPEVPPVE